MVCLNESIPVPQGQIGSNGCKRNERGNPWHVILVGKGRWKRFIGWIAEKVGRLGSDLRGRNINETCASRAVN